MSFVSPQALLKSDSPSPSCSLGDSILYQRAVFTVSSREGSFQTLKGTLLPQHIVAFWKPIRWYHPGTVPFWEPCGKAGTRPGMTSLHQAQQRSKEQLITWSGLIQLICPKSVWGRLTQTSLLEEQWKPWPGAGSSQKWWSPLPVVLYMEEVTCTGFDRSDFFSHCKHLQLC